MKYSCYGCKYVPYNRKNKLCTTCTNYVLSEDGESTVQMHSNWTPKENKS